MGDEQFAVKKTAEPATAADKTEEQWRESLTPDQFNVLRQHGTERAGTSPLNREKRQGRLLCAGCGEPLLPSDTKCESGTGWPSFWSPLEDSVATTEDRTFGMSRTEVH